MYLSYKGHTDQLIFELLKSFAKPGPDCWQHRFRLLHCLTLVCLVGMLPNSHSYSYQLLQVVVGIFLFRMCLDLFNARLLLLELLVVACFLLDQTQNR
jgi:hypothetical protein